MSKTKSEYTCANCGYKSPKWLGRCPVCQEWESFGLQEGEKPGSPVPTREITPIPINRTEHSKPERWPLGWKFTDRMLGGGLVPGSLILLGGSPGVGKSTLLLQWANALAQQGKTVLYCSAEETEHQLQLRGTRLGVLNPQILVISENSLEAILNTITSTRPDTFVLDSIQMVHSQDMGGPPGSLSQVRECTARLMEFTKQNGITGIIVGHITKEGTLAGPKSMEHMVDVVIQLEGERGGATRILRVSKNRYGPTLELDVLTMTKRGLREVDNPSQLFLKDRTPNSVGSVVTASLEGNSPLLLEVQALVGRENQGIPKRVVMGADLNRLTLVTAVLEKSAGLHLSSADIHLNIPGGIRLTEPSADLAMAMAMVSSFLKKPFLESVVFGEIGLGGEVRMVPGVIQRIQEALRMGFKTVVLPQKNIDELNWKGSKQVRLIGVSRIEEAVEICHNASHRF